MLGSRVSSFSQNPLRVLRGGLQFVKTVCIAWIFLRLGRICSFILELGWIYKTFPETVTAKQQRCPLLTFPESPEMLFPKSSKRLRKKVGLHFLALSSPQSILSRKSINLLRLFDHVAHSHTVKYFQHRNSSFFLQLFPQCLVEHVLHVHVHVRYVRYTCVRVVRYSFDSQLHVLFLLLFFKCAFTFSLFLKIPPYLFLYSNSFYFVLAAFQRFPKFAPEVITSCDAGYPSVLPSGSGWILHGASRRWGMSAPYRPV